MTDPKLNGSAGKPGGATSKQSPRVVVVQGGARRVVK